MTTEINNVDDYIPGTYSLKVPGPSMIKFLSLGNLCKTFARLCKPKGRLRKRKELTNRQKQSYLPNYLLLSIAINKELITNQ